MEKRKNHCQARRVNDQMMCHLCGMAWDITDPERPDCDPQRDFRTRKARLLTAFEKEAQEAAKTAFPEVLSEDVRNQMDKAYRANGEGSGGMQAAYRVLLDMVSV